MKKPSNNDPVVVGGLTPLTTIDYPGELAAVIFLQGCPWRCGYCQNNELLDRRHRPAISWQQVMELLQNRQGLLDAVVFSGGEPTLQSGLYEAMHQVKSLRYKIGLHTAGIYPEALKKLLPLLDWVGMDIKSAQADYPSITGVAKSGARAWKSARVLIDSGVDYEFRTTVHPDMLNQSQLTALVAELKAIQAQHFVIQECVTRNCLQPARRISNAPTLEHSVINKFAEEFMSFEIRSH